MTLIQVAEVGALLLLLEAAEHYSSQMGSGAAQMILDHS